MTFVTPHAVSLAKVARAIDSGLSVHEAAAELGISRVTLWRYSQKIGRSFRDEKPLTGRAKLMVDAIAAGITTSDALAAHFGLERRKLSVELNRVAKRGFIKSVGRRKGVPGRPYTIWELGERRR